MLEGDRLYVPRKKNFHTPDEILDSDLEHTKIVTIDHTTFKKRVLHPGWKTTETYEDTHIHCQLTGRMHIRLDNGIEIDFKPGDVGILPPGLSSWVEGEKLVTVLEITERTAIAGPEIEEERMVIRKRAGDLITAINTRDAKNVAELFAEQADFINAKGKTIYGRTAIEKYFETYLQNPLLNNYFFRIYGGRTRIIGPNVSNVDLYWDLVESDGMSQSVPYSAGLMDLLLTKSQDQWNILTMHSINLIENLEQGHKQNEDQTGMIISW